MTIRQGGRILLHDTGNTPEGFNHDERLPENLGHYRITRLIGRGGMGAVYKAVCETSHEIVAIKTIRVPRGRMVSHDQVSRFKQEAEFLAHTQHPNIVHFIDFGVQDELMFLVMEYVEGQTLRSYLSRHGQLGVKEILDIAIQIAEVVHTLQGNSLVHRDLKPQNIMLTPTLGMDLVKVLDFGISGLSAEASGLQSSSGYIMGTVAYSSPEQSGLIDATVDGRSDLYSFGVIFFEMLTGSPPFTGDPESVTYQHLSTEPPAIKSLRKDVPDPISNIVAKLLQKNPDDRYQTGYGLLHDLKECRRALASGEQNWDIPLGSHDHFQGLHFTSRLIGRERHSIALQKSIELAKNSTSHVIQITGELGVGKSFLLSDFHLKAVQKHCTFLTSRLQRMAFDCGLQPLGQMLDTYFMQILRASEQKRKKVLELLTDVITAHAVTLLRNIPSAREVISQVMESFPETLEEISYNIESTRPGELDSSAQVPLGQALNACLLEIAKIEECLVLEIDSIHWADDEVFTFLEELAVSASTLPCKLLCILTANFESPTGIEGCQRLVHNLRQRSVYVHQISLEPFTLDDVKDFVSDLLTDSPEVADSLSQTLHAFTKGNPLFLREALKSMVVYGNLAFDNTTRHWRCVKRDLSNLKLPADVVDLIIERTKPFSQETKRTLSAAARLGFSFSQSMLATILPETSGTLNEALEQARTEHLIQERDGRFSFAHSKIREFFINCVDKTEAAELHFRILKLLNSTPFDDQITQLREYAHHAYFAGSKVDPEIACAACAQLAIAEDDLGELQRHQEQLQRALEIARASSSSRLQDSVLALEIQLADALRRLGQGGRAQRILENTLSQIGSRLTAFPMDLFFLAVEKLHTVKVMRGLPLTLEYAGQNLEDISLSLVRTEVDLHEANGETESVLHMAQALLKFGEPGRIDSSTELRSRRGNSQNFSETTLTIEQRLRNLVEHPHGLAGIFLGDDQRLKSSVQFLFSAHLIDKNPEVIQLLDNLWVLRKDLFLCAHPDFLWSIWLEDFSSETERTSIQLLIETILESISVSGQTLASTARIYTLCCKSFVEWREMEIKDILELKDQLTKAIDACRTVGSHYASIWALLVKSGFLFLQGEWDELIKAAEEAIAEAEHLDYPAVALECLAQYAVLGAFRDKSRLDRSLEHIRNDQLRPRIEALLRLATLFDDFAENPVDANLESAWRFSRAKDSLWLRSHPLMVFGNFLSISTRIASVCDGRSGSAFSANAILAKLRHEVDEEFPELVARGYTNLFRRLLLHGLECSAGNHNEITSGFFSVEAEAIKYKVLSWLTVSRLQIYRIKIAEARKRDSQSLADEASVHLVASEKVASDAGFSRLSESLEAMTNHMSHTDELSRTSTDKSLSHGVSSIMGRLKLDKVFSYSSMLLTKQNIDELLPPALEAFVEFTGAQRGAILVRDRISTTFSLKALYGVPHDNDIFQRIVVDAVSDIEYDLPISWSVVMRVRTEGRIVIVHNAQTDESIANQFSVVKNRIRSVLGLPLVHNDELLGIVYLDSCLLNDLFNRDSVKLIQPIARQVAFSISNIWLKKSSEEAYLALKQSQKYLIQSEKMAGIGTMAASVAHDFRTPLSIVLGLAEDIRELVRDGQISAIEDNASRIIKAAQKLQRLVQSMQDFSRKSTRELGPVSLRKVVDEVMFLTEKKLKQFGVEVSIILQKDLPHLHGNANELEQVFMNLVNNAADAMESATLRNLRIEGSLRSDGAVEVQISDTGCGIPESEKRNIFQPFFTTKPVGKGTGLGLSIVNTLVQGQSGSIRFESTTGRGTTFFLSLPSIDRTGNVVGRQRTAQDMEPSGE